MAIEGGVSLEELFAPRELPAGHDPLADGILMPHQAEWLEDQSDLKIAAKGRRTGITYAEALDDCILAATKGSDGGDNVYYVPDVKEKGLEYIRYVAHFARVVSKELSAVYEEFLFPDKQANGETKYITAWRVSFASGNRVVALSSRPANIRGLQGTVVIDEAAFHDDVEAVLDAVNALLIWGGKVRIISSHNGEENAFNRLIKDTQAGLYDYKIHHIPFSKAVKNGLYERVCLMKGDVPTPDGFKAWLNKVLRSYGPRHEARDEELEAIPRRSSGVYFPRAMIQAAQGDNIPTLRLSVSETFYLQADRLAVTRRWVTEHLTPLLDGLDPIRRSVFGQDFGRTGDLSVIQVAQEESRTTWRTAFMVEMRRVPFDCQQLILFAICDRLPGFRGKLDARGNGQSHAEAAQQKYGVFRIECVMATAAWYAEHFPKYQTALVERTFILASGEDVVTDHGVVVLKNGFPTMSDRHNKGVDGEQRHGDSAIAGLLCHASTLGDVQPAGASIASPPLFIPSGDRYGALIAGRRTRLFGGR